MCRQWFKCPSEYILFTSTLWPWTCTKMSLDMLSFCLLRVVVLVVGGVYFCFGFVWDPLELNCWISNLESKQQPVIIKGNFAAAVRQQQNCQNVELFLIRNM